MQAAVRQAGKCVPEKRSSALQGTQAELISFCVQVGAQTETELKEKKLRVEDALNATKAAVEEGIVAGGGSTLLKLAQKVLRMSVGHATYLPKCNKQFVWSMPACSANICMQARFLLDNSVATVGSDRKHCFAQVDAIKNTLENDERKVGAEIVRRSLGYPLKLIANNAGVNGSVVQQKVLESSDPNVGYNASTGKQPPPLHQAMIQTSHDLRDVDAR